MEDHDSSLWNYVNGLVVDASNSLNNKRQLQREASKFSTDQILSEIASTFNSHTSSAGAERSNSLQSEDSNVSNISGISNITPYPVYPTAGEPQKESYNYNGASFYGV